MARTVAVGLAALAFSFLAMRHHEDALSGVDTGAYGLLAADLASGSPAVAGDALLSSVPPGLAEAFLYRPLAARGGIALRPTRNCAYQLVPAGDGWARRPFYMAGYPLAVAGSRLGHAFMPLVGALFCLSLALAAGCRHGLAGVACAAAALCATPYPAWFFRGDYPEVAAAAAPLAVALSCLARRPLRPWEFAIAGFAAVFPMALHPTALLIAGPAGLLLVFMARGRRSCAALLCGLAAGLLPAVWLTRCISAPYGDWTRPLRLLRVARAAPEHAAMLAALCAMLLLAAAALAASRCARLRAGLSRMIGATPAPAVAAVAILPLAAMLAIPCGAAEELRFALPLAVASLRAPALLLAALAVASLSGGGHPKEKALLVLFAWCGCVFLLVFGHETFPFKAPPAGIWNFRRLAPPVLALLAVAAQTIPALFGRAGTRPARCALAALLAVVALANPVRSPAAYAAVSGEGTDAAVRETLRAIDRAGADIVVFDYFPHSVPSGVLRRNVLGLAPHAYGRWGDVADWIGGMAAAGRKVCLVSSYGGGIPRVEKGFTLAPRESLAFARRVVKSRRFLDAAVSDAPMTLDFLDAAPLAGRDGAASGECAQRIGFTGGPVGLRGGWTPAGRGGFWSRQDSGFAAPLPQPGADVEATFDIEWVPPECGPTNRIMRIDFEGNRYLAMLRVTPGRHTVTTRFVSDRALPPAGAYAVSTPAPYDPASHGLRGYPPDLGVVFHSIEVRRVPESGEPRDAGGR